MKQNELMGKVVTINKQFDRVYKGNWRKWKIVDREPMQGWIVGFRTIWDGYMDYECGDYDERLSGDYFVHDSHHNCVLVSFSPRQNPVNVPLDGFELTDTPIQGDPASS